MSWGRDNVSGRGKGFKLKIEGRIFGYEIVDFSIVIFLENVLMIKIKIVSLFFLGKEK